MTEAFEACVSTRALRPMLAGMQLHGVDIERVLADIGLDPAVIVDPEARVPHRLAIALWDLAIARTGDDALGLHIAATTDFGVAFDVQSYAFASSPTLGEGFRRIASYHRLNHDAARVECDRQYDVAIVRHVLPGGLALPRALAEFVVTTIVHATRSSTSGAAEILEVRFAHPEPSDTAEHRRLLAAPLRFAAGENALVIPAAALELPLARADPRLLGVLDRHAHDLLERLAEVRTFVDRVRAVLAAELRGGNPSAEHVAEVLHMSVRTLARRLDAEGTWHKVVLDALRRELAIRHLEAGELAIGEVAFLLGFSEASAFHRAFRRWTGKTPAEARRGSPTKNAALARSV